MNLKLSELKFKMNVYSAQDPLLNWNQYLKNLRLIIAGVFDR